uniref:non-specific serine/threonine protein kinase n=1 Tax=Vernicia fordii TaxID=73154 RepID=A0A127AXJ9_VERFO|nr:LRR-RLK [Vernicia fordii]
MPQYIGNWSSLIYLDLSFNNLHGQIPDYMKNLSLNKMFLTRNMLDGVLPSWIHHSIQSKADLSYNNFTKIKFDKRRNQNSSINRPQIYNNVNIIPQRNDILEIKNISCKGKSKNDYLFINCGGQQARYNGILYDGDTVTSNFYLSPNEKWAYACSGDFISTTPYSTDFFRNVSGVSTLETSVYDTARLCPLSLTYYGFCLPDGNYTVKLHFAETIYARDADYSSLGQRVFDVYIQGERRLKDFNIKEEAGGPYKAFTKELWAIVKDNLLEIHFYWAGKGSLYNPPALNGPLVSAIDIAPPNFKFPDGKLSTGQIAGIVVGCTLAPLLLLALMWKMGWLGKRESDEICIEVQERSFTLTQIIAATRNFSRQTEIGKGHIGIVYKAGMPFNVTFAVKKISPQKKQQEKDKIQREIFNLLSLRHENLVQLLGSCSRKGHHILIYEYMENGSLHQALFEPDSTIELDWKARYDICLGIAKGLKYLHEDKRFEIVHGNITARNILLDKNHTPKISDFGLARFRDDEDAFTTIKTRERLYVAPEYFLGKAITVKADVYSFGVVALEIVSGRTSMEQRPNQEYDVLLDTAYVLYAKGKILNLVDEKLSSSYDRKQALILLDIAIMCINSQSPSLRPKMSDVVSVLSFEKTIEQISSADTH